MALPDVARECPSDNHSPQVILDWVGMNNIDLPMSWQDKEAAHQVTAHADIHVSLPAGSARGIHMSRLYTLLTQFKGDQTTSSSWTPEDVSGLLQRALDTHTDCGSQSARVKFRFDVLTQRPGLLSTQLSGWRRYPVQIEATLTPDGLRMSQAFTVTYSSTCPCSAALSRQALCDAFAESFGHPDQINVAQAMAWLQEHGSLATPHSQRSQATITLPLSPHAHQVPLLPWINLSEAALGTPVQTAVKRIDEQAFARLNGANLMYVEDALRRLHRALTDAGAPGGTHIEVAHLESLHPHDAVASTTIHRLQD